MTKTTKTENLHNEIKLLQLTAEKDLGFCYESLDKRYSELKISEKKKRISTEQLLKSLDDLLEEYRTSLIIEFCDLLLKTIQEKNKRTQDFGELIVQVQQIKKQTQELVMTKELYQKYYEEELPVLTFKIRYKLKIDIKTKKRFWLGIIVGAILGFVLGIVGSIIVYAIGFH